MVEFKIWMAGFYEGEGCISNDISNNNKLRLSISQNDPTPLFQAQKVWGGSIRPRVRITATGKTSEGNEWRISHHASMQFIDDIRPYMRIPYKIEQIETCLRRAKEGNTRRFKCHFCDNDYANPSGRRRHEKYSHASPLKGSDEVLVECRSL